MMRELEDRWILPLRGSRIERLRIQNKELVLLLDSGKSISVGVGSRWTPGNGTKEDPHIKPASEWGEEFLVKEFSGREILSAVGFKSGTLRVTFDNGWRLINRPKFQDGGESVVESDGSAIWTAAGLPD